MKVMQERKYSVSFITLLSSISGMCISAIYCSYKYWFFWPIEWLPWLLLLAFGNTLFYFFSIQTRVKSLKNIDTTIFFPLHKTFWPLLVLAISFLFFDDSISFKELVGIGVWIIVPLMLITKSENKVQKNLKLGILFIFFTSILAAISSIFPKQAYVLSMNMDLFTFFMLLFWTFISGISYFFIEKKKVIIDKWMIKFWTLFGILYFWALMTFNLAMEWNLAVVITINSFSILIPIILSVIFYKEEMTYKKAFVIFLSIVSVILFI